MLPRLPLFVLEALEPRRTLSAAADVDSGFGIDGSTAMIRDFQPILDNDDRITMCVQYDGKVIVAGSYYGNDFFIQRYNPDGTPDTSFHGGIRRFFDTGMAAISGVRAARDGSIFILSDQVVRLDSSGEFVTAYGPTEWTVSDWAIDSSGKVIVVDEAYGIARYNADGTPDSTFNNGNPLDLMAWGDVYKVRPTRDGKIVAYAGHFNTNDEYELGLYRLNSDGTQDSTFNNGPFGILPRERYRSLQLMSDGSILLAGGVGWRRDDFVIRKFHPDGTPDNSFDNDGYVRTNLGSGYDILSYAIGEPDGGVLAVGSYSSYYYVKVRYRPDGSVDTAWGNNGRMFSHLREDIQGWSAQSDVGGGVVVLSFLNREYDGDWGEPMSGFFLTRYVFTNTDPAPLPEDEVDDGTISDEEEDEGDEEFFFDGSDWIGEGDDEEAGEAADENSDDLLDESDDEVADIDWTDESDLWE